MADRAAEAADDAGFQTILSGALRLEACSACQLRCPSCPTTTGHTAAVVGKNTLSFADFARLIDANPWIGEIELSNYGEVFLNPQLSRILRHAFERNVTLKIENGANLNHVREAVLEDLVRYRVAMLTCSIDGASQATYARYRVRGDFDRVIANIRRINAFKKAHGSAVPELRWQFIVFGHNEHELPAAKNLAAELGMSFLVKLSWDPDFSPVADEALVRGFAGAASRAEFEIMTGRAYMQDICGQLWASPQVNWDGKILGCCRNFWGDFGGNAFRDGLAASLNHETIRYAREMLAGRAPAREGVPCTQCEIYHKRRATNRWIAWNPSAGRRDPGARVTRLWRKALLCRSEDHIEQAAAFARVVLQLAPNHPGALVMLGEEAARAGRETAARYYFDKAEAARPPALTKTRP
jgi:hypothetical protein